MSAIVEKDRLAHALEMAARGFRVFPLAAGSKVPPKSLHWQEVATTDPGQIADWWRGNPGYNIGVATGRGLLVVDVDVKGGKPGLESLETLQAMGLPVGGFHVETASGGRHIYLRVDREHRNQVDLADFPGIDIRADGGYVVGPGSVIGGKVYTEGRDSAAIAKAPVWFEEQLGRRTAQASVSREPMIELDLPHHVEMARDYLQHRAPEAVEGAGGDQVTYSVAARCRGFGLSAEKTFELMTELWNEQKASPPWDLDELRAKVDNAFNYATGAWGGDTAAGEFGEFDTADLDIGEVPESVKRIAGQALTKAADKAAADKSDGMPGLRFRFLDLARMQAMPEPEWLVPGVVPHRSSTLLFGESNTFKSFLAIDIGLHVATGRPWHGQRVRQTRVALVATEGAIGVGRQRVPGWYDHYGVPACDRGGFFLVPQELEVDVDAEVDKLLSDCRQLGIGLVVLDIFGGTMAGVETEHPTARAWFKGVRRLIAAGIAVFVVAHTGWQDKSRARMHTHFWGSFDSRLRAEGDKEKLTTVLSVERHKDADSRGKWGFRLEPSQGTLIPILDAGVAERAKGDRLPAAQAKALACFEAAVAEHGELRHGEGWPMMCQVVAVEKWKAACDGGAVLAKPGATPDAGRKAFDRARDELMARGILKERDGFFWSAADAE